MQTPRGKLLDLVVNGHFLQKVLPHLDRAKVSIDVLCFFWKFPVRPWTGPVGTLMLALKNAQIRGVKVRILAGSDTFVSYLRLQGFESRRVHTKKLMHAKLMILDGRTAIIGSHNYTVAAFTENTEVSAIVEVPEVPNDVTTLFKNLWGL